MDVDDDLPLALPTLEPESGDKDGEEQPFGAIDEDLALPAPEEDPDAAGSGGA